MYSTCLFCHASLGANEVVEHFPVGRRLAFDAAKGRLWVVCMRCGRWNLTPLEERWEALEECERLFRDARLRASSGQIRVARLEDRAELVRIGRPERPEFAAWRYGDQFGERRKRAIARGTVAALAGAAVAFNAPFAVGVGLVSVCLGVELGVRVPWHLAAGANQRLLRHPHGGLLRVSAAQADRARIVAVGGGGWGLQVEYDLRMPDEGRPLGLASRDGRAGGEVTLVGGDAVRTLGVLLARVNTAGASAAELRGAVQQLDAAGGPDRLIPDVGARARAWAEQQRWQDAGSIGMLPLQARLALEMAAHEESERRAMEGELAELEGAWRDAEEIAAIADDLLLPESVAQRLDAIKLRR